jgi:16S rRNA (cytosine1402-N4)-methyltransferase
MSAPHISVLMEQILASFSEMHILTFVDGTLGAGGHSEAILRNHPEIQQMIGIDQDPQALAIAAKRLESWQKKIQLVSGNFSDIDLHLDQINQGRVDGMLLDLGVSSMQLDQPEKGFSFSKEGPLDMRMDPSQELTAAEIINTWSEEDLGRIFREYGEEKRWRAAARVIGEARVQNEIHTTLELAEILKRVLWWNKKKGINPLTLIFQALRIAVNRELERIEDVIPKMIQRLKPGGRLAVISFHSLEDRIVKNAFRYAASDKEDTSGIAGVFLSKEPEVRMITRKPIVANPDEIERNPRSRSAKLRVVERI